MNLPGNIGEEVTVSIVTPDGTSVEKEYTLVGVIQDYSDITDRRNNDLFDMDESTGTPWPNPDPLAIISSAEGESYAAEYCNVTFTYVGGDVGENHFEELDASFVPDDGAYHNDLNIFHCVNLPGTAEKQLSYLACLWNEKIWDQTHDDNGNHFILVNRIYNRCFVRAYRPQNHYGDPVPLF
jgi:hypothetical protein